MQPIKILDILKNTADVAIKNQAPNGAFPAGHNGPYFDNETPVRCTAHYLYLLANLFSTTKDEKYKLASLAAINYLKSREARPNNKTFHCRNKLGKDKCNGLVGQAWVIESLVKASEVFDSEDCYALAEECFLLHPWVTGMGVWRRVEIDGNILSIDTTFNHQLWFAMAAAMLHKTPVAQERAKIFLDAIVTNVELYDNGVVFHDSQLGKLRNYLYLGPKIFLAQIKSLFIKLITKNKLYYKSVGYHGFNLFALAQLKKLLPNEVVWNKNLINRVLKVTETDKFIFDLVNSEFGYFYNLSGLEIAYALNVFNEDKDKIQRWIDRQFEYAGEKNSCSLTKNVLDTNTALARIYIAGNLYDFRVSFND